MNAMLNINIRVASAAAQAQLKALESRVNGLAGAGARAGGAGGLGAMNGALGRMANLEKFGKNLQWTGRQLEYNFTLPLVLAGAASTKWALDNERASTQIRKVYGELGDDAGMLRKELDALSTSFELLSSRYGVVQSEVIEIGAAWAQAGAAGVAVAKATRLTLDAMILGEMDAIEATNGVIAVQSAYRLNTEQLKDALAQLNIVENQTSINFHGLIDVITRAGGTARTAGIDIRHLAAMAASLVPATGSAAQAGNALRTMISRLMAPTQQAAELMEMMGININDASWQALDGVGRIEKMASSFDSLTQAQKAVVSSAVASRWQINRFDILMEDIAKSLDEATENQSAYNRALDATADKAKYSAVYAKELATVLSSSPKAFSILTKTIQNAMAKAILPMLPTIIAVLAEVAKLVTAFTNLDPAVQKALMSFALLVALVGPLTRYLGSFILLFTTFGHVVHFLRVRMFGLAAAQLAATVAAQGHNATLYQQHGLIGLLTTAIWTLIKLPFAALSLAAQAVWISFYQGSRLAVLGVVGFVKVVRLIPSLLLTAQAAFVRFGALVSTGLAAAMGVGTSAVATAARTIPLILNAALLAMQGAFRAFVSVVQVAFTSIPYFVSVAGAAMARAWQLALAAMQGALRIFYAAVWAIPRVVGIVRNAIVAIWATLPYIIQGIGNLIALAMAYPWVAIAAIAAVAIVALAVMFRDQIGGAVQWVIDAFGQLPEAIVTIFRQVVNIVREAALAVYEWLSYLNPFARHSPSLVESVTRGISTVLDQYARLNAVPGIIRRAVTAMQDFKRSTGSQMADFQMGEFQEQKKEIVAVAPGAAGEVDRLINSIFEMYHALELVNQQISEQTRLVDDMARRIDTAMKPYNDAIFANEMAQKKLRLEILKMKQAGQSIDDIRNKMALLSGEIETLRGDQTELRLAGAGSDVLSFYDDQIAALEAQRNAMEGQKGPLEEIQKQLDELQLAGEILELEKAIKFDPQLRALQEQEDKLSDLKAAYSEINSVINDMEGALRSSASAAKATTDALKGAGLSSAQEQFNAAAAGDFEVPGGDAPPGLGREGGLAEIEAFNAEMEAELQRALDDMGGLDMFAPIKDMWNAAWGWIKDNVGPVVQPVIDAVKNFFGGLEFDGGGLGGFIDFLTEAKGTMGSIIGDIISYYEGLWGALQAFWGFLKEVFGPVFKWLWSQVKKFGTAIGNELENWAPMFGQIVEAVGHIVSVLSWIFTRVLIPLFKITLGIILGVWKLAWPVLKHVLTPIIDAIIGVVRAGLEIVRGIIFFVLNVINGEWGALWGNILTILDGIWDAIYSVISVPLGLIYGLIRGFIEGVIGFFQWLYDMLVGHSIVPDLVDGIIFWFKLLLNVVKFIWSALWTAIKFVWDNVVKPVFEAIKWAINNVLIPAFNGFKSVVSTVWNGISSVIKTVWGTIKSIFQGIIDFVRDKLGAAFTTVKDTILNAFRGVRDTIGGIWDSIKSTLRGGVNFGIRAVNKITGGVNKIADLIPGLDIHINPIQELARGGTIDPRRSGPFVTDGVRAIVGEGSRIHPEYVIPTDPRFRDRAAGLFAQLAKDLGIPGFAAGGNLPGPADEIVGWGADKIAGAASAIKEFWSMIDSVTKTISNLDIPFVKGLARFVKDKGVEWAKDQISKIPGVGIAGNIIGGVADVAGGVAGAAKSGWEKLPFTAMGGILQLAHGGIVAPRAGGTLANLAERGRAEAVVPLPADFGSGGNTYNFYDSTFEFPNVTDADDAEAFLKNLDTVVAA